MEVLRIREQQELIVVSEFKVKNQQLFVMNMRAMKEKELLQAHSSCLESALPKSCKSMPKLHITKDAQLESKVRKLLARVR